MTLDPDRPCPHENFSAEVDINRIGDGDDPVGEVKWFCADIRVRCAECLEKFRWIGVPAGLSPRQPMVSVDGTELRAPLRPASSDDDFGMGLPGFSVLMPGRRVDGDHYPGVDTSGPDNHGIVWPGR